MLKFPNQPLSAHPPPTADMFAQVCAITSVKSPLFVHCEIEHVNHVGLLCFFSLTRLVLHAHAEERAEEKGSI